MSSTRITFVSYHSLSFIQRAIRSIFQWTLMTPFPFACVGAGKKSSSSTSLQPLEIIVLNSDITTYFKTYVTTNFHLSLFFLLHVVIEIDLVLRITPFLLQVVQTIKCNTKIYINYLLIVGSNQKKKNVVNANSSTSLRLRSNYSDQQFQLTFIFVFVSLLHVVIEIDLVSGITSFLLQVVETNKHNLNIYIKYLLIVESNQNENEVNPNSSAHLRFRSNYSELQLQLTFIFVLSFFFMQLSVSIRFRTFFLHSVIECFFIKVLYVNDLFQVKLTLSLRNTI